MRLFALSSNIIVAEKGSRLGFPEILFNLFPGMGAYTLLYRKVGMKITEELITSGNTYTAEDLAKMGVVDILVPQGEAEKYVFELMQKQKNMSTPQNLCTNVAAIPILSDTKNLKKL